MDDVDCQAFDRYEERTQTSRRLFEAAKEVFPGGDTRAAVYHEPYPSFVASASGCTVTTVDGEELVDFLNNYSVTILGHAPPAVTDAVAERLQRGNAVGAPTEDATALARRLVERVPSLDRIRFCNSGTEATMNAIRVTRAYSGNDRVLMVAGGFHGYHDAVSGGVPATDCPATGAGELTLTTPFNDVEALKAAFERHGRDLACFVVEPVLGAGGMIRGQEEFLEAARDLTEATGTPLVFDEIQSFRLAVGGAQQRYGVVPDVTTLGKVIGGGLPIGAFGGREDILAECHPERGTITHTGTFNANPATMAGGIATLDALDEATIDRLNRRGADVRERLEAIGAASDVPVTVTGDGSFFQIHITDGPVRREADVPEADGPRQALFLHLRNEGVFTAPRGMGNLSTPMGDEAISVLTEAVSQALPAVEEGL